jgi:hypothetical protein
MLIPENETERIKRLEALAQPDRRDAKGNLILN